MLLSMFRWTIWYHTAWSSDTLSALSDSFKYRYFRFFLLKIELCYKFGFLRIKHVNNRKLSLMKSLWLNHYHLSYSALLHDSVAPEGRIGCLRKKILNSDHGSWQPYGRVIKEKYYFKSCSLFNKEKILYWYINMNFYILKAILSYILTFNTLLIINTDRNDFIGFID